MSIKRKRPIGVTVFCVIYNLLGFVSLSACFYGFNSLSQANALIIGEKDYVQILAIVITVLFFLSSFLLMKLKRLGYLIPILILSFFIAGGFVIVLPVMIAHIIYFTRPHVNQLFT